MTKLSSQNDLHSPGAVLLLSCYELGHQPQGLAVPASFLEAAGYHPTCVDLAVQTLSDEAIDQAAFVAISVPMHTALRLGRRVAQRIRARKPTCRIVFFGHYALLHAKALLRSGSLVAPDADAVLGGECEGQLLRMLEDPRRGAAPSEGAPSLEKLEFPVPQRAHLPGLSSYAHLQIQGEHRLAGYLETTRGCRHLCTHCPLPAVYNGRLFAVGRETVLQDARQQIEAGARHLTFGDPDFLNAPGHGVRILRELHQQSPKVTFDFTAKIEHLNRHAALLPELAEAGVLFVVTAVETLNDQILEILDKGHTEADVRAAQRALQGAGIVMRPSLMPFTPWTQWRDLQDILEWVSETDLVDSVDTVQYSIRLLVPRGSLLQEHPAMLAHRGEYDEDALTYLWKHEDAGLDALQGELMRLAEVASERGETPSATFASVWDLVQERSPRHSAASRPAAPVLRRRQRSVRITEPWFC